MNEALELFKKLTSINDYDPYLCFEDNKWIICWLKLGYPDSEDGGDVLMSFSDKDLAVAIQKAYNWLKYGNN